MVSFQVYCICYTCGIPEAYLQSPRAIRICVIERGVRIRGKYLEMVSVLSVVRTTGKDEIAQGALRREEQETKLDRGGIPEFMRWVEEEGPVEESEGENSLEHIRPRKSRV